MNEPAPPIRDEPRWPPALAILVVLCLLAVFPHHVQVMPVWVFHVATLAMLVTMAAVTLTPAHTLWRRIERLLIMLLAVAYVANTFLGLVDMIGVITLHPSQSNAFALLSSSVAIWVANVLTFSMVYWQIDRGGPYARASKVRVNALLLALTGASLGERPLQQGAGLLGIEPARCRRTPSRPRQSRWSYALKSHGQLYAQDQRVADGAAAARPEDVLQIGRDGEPARDGDLVIRLQHRLGRGPGDEVAEHPGNDPR
jgi:glucan phosphoethanolaminetransferase (alkaline phosphatase superfamily)